VTPTYFFALYNDPTKRRLGNLPTTVAEWSMLHGGADLRLVLEAVTPKAVGEVRQVVVYRHDSELKAYREFRRLDAELNVAQGDTIRATFDISLQPDGGKP
jgi:hypothetical protein